MHLGRDVIYEGPAYNDGKNMGMILTMMAPSVKTFPLFMHPFTPMTQFTGRVCEDSDLDAMNFNIIGVKVQTLPRVNICWLPLFVSYYAQSNTNYP